MGKCTLCGKFNLSVTPMKPVCRKCLAKMEIGKSYRAKVQEPKGRFEGLFY